MNTKEDKNKNKQPFLIGIENSDSDLQEVKHIRQQKVTKKERREKTDDNEEKYTDNHQKTSKLVIVKGSLCFMLRVRLY